MKRFDREHSKRFGDRGSVYVVDDGDADTEDVRLQFVTCHSICGFDFTPAELYSIGKLIIDSLHDEGFCEHGENIGECEQCTLKKDIEFEKEFERQREQAILDHELDREVMP